MDPIKEKKKVKAIVYTDGSCLNGSNNKIGQFFSSAHGYIYNEDITIKNADKIKKWNITNNGYKKSLDSEDTLVTPIQYFNHIKTIEEETDANTAELLALIFNINKLIELEEYEFNKIKIWTDSNYVIHIFNTIDKERDIPEDIPLYKETIDSFSEVLNKLKSLNILLEIDFIKGHDGNLGNDIADRLTRVFHNENIVGDKEIFYLSDSHKYWNINIERHPFLKFDQLLIDHKRDLVSDYSLLDYSPSEILASKTNNSCFGLTIMREPVEELNNIINYYKNSIDDNINYKIDPNLSILNLNNFYSKETFEWFKYNKNAFKFSSKRNILYNFANEILAYPLLGLNNVLAAQFNRHMDIFKNIFLEYKKEERDSQYLFYDVTNHFYSIQNDNVNNNIYKCNIKNGINHIKIKIPAINPESKKIKIPISLKLGKDCLERNFFKTLEKHEPKVYICLILDPHLKLYSYYLITEDKDENIGIYTNLYVNKTFSF